MNVKPGAVFEAVIDTGLPGLVGTITVEANDNTGGTAILPSGLGIAEIASGVYAASGLVAPDTGGQYTLIWKAADAGVLGIEDLLVTGSAPADGIPPSDTYATTDELFRILKIRTPTADQVTAAQRCLEAAAGEINSKMGRQDDLEPWQAQLCAEVNLERAVEHWSQQEVPFGVIGLDSPSGPTYLPRKSRALAKLLPNQQSFGVGWAPLPEIVEALAEALEPLRDEIPDLQIYPYWLASASPPTIDIYPGDPFMDGLGFGGGADMFFTVRARVTTADSTAGQQLLYQILEPDTGVTAALTADQTLGGVVDSVAIGEEGTPGVSGLREYVEDVAVNGRLLGCEWRVRVLT